MNRKHRRMFFKKNNITNGLAKLWITQGVIAFMGRRNGRNLFIGFKNNELLMYSEDLETHDFGVMVTDDFAKALGYKDVHSYLSSDETLDTINELHKHLGRFPLTKQ